MLPHPDSLNILSAIIPVALMVAGIKRPIYAVIGYMYFVYWKVAHLYPIFYNLQAELVFGLFTLGWSIFSCTDKQRFSFHFDRTNQFFFFFVVSLFISFIFAWDHSFSWDKVVYHFLKVVLLTIASYAAIRNKRDLNLFIWGFIVLYVYLAYEPLYRFLTGEAAQKQLYGDVYVSDLGILSGHVALANNMNQMIPIAFFLLFTVRRNIFRVIAAVPLVMFLLALVGSASRGGVVGLIAILFLIIGLSWQKIFRYPVIPALFVLVIILSLPQLMYTLGRIDTINTSSRLVRVVHGLEMVRRGNIFGVGPGCYILASGKYFGHTMMSHNLYGQVIGDLGIPGTITWFLFIGQIFCNLRKATRIALKNFSNHADIYYISLGLTVSLIIRLFVGLGSHCLYFFYWYIVAVISIFLLKMLPDDS